jgi:hypothetical protein
MRVTVTTALVVIVTVVPRVAMTVAVGISVAAVDLGHRARGSLRQKLSPRALAQKNK